MNYRTVQKTTVYQSKLEVYEILGIWIDEGKGGEVYKDGYIWSLFTFNVIPEIPANVLEWVEESDYTKNLHLIDGITIRAKTIGELENE